MVGILLVIWGGFLLALTVALRRERTKTNAAD
jgi:hypothetical protein